MRQAKQRIHTMTMPVLAEAKLVVFKPTTCASANLCMAFPVRPCGPKDKTGKVSRQYVTLTHDGYSTAVAEMC